MTNSAIRGGGSLILNLDLAQEDTYLKKSAFNLKKNVFKMHSKRVKKINNYLIVTNSIWKWTVY